MARAGATLLILGLLSCLVACDTASENEGCTDPQNPGARGSDPSKCPRSTFTADDTRTHEVAGIVRRGEDGVPGAAVHVSRSERSTGDDVATTGDAITDDVGFYRIGGAITTLYDLSMTLPGGAGGRKDLLVYRGVADRYIEPQLDIVGRSLPRSWVGHVEVRVDPPLPASHAIVFLATGDGVYGVTGDLSTGLDVHTAKYVNNANIQAIEYDAAQGLIGATAYAAADVISDAGTPKIVLFHLQPITATASISFALASIPPGFVPGPVEIRVSASRTSDARVVSVPWESPTLTFPIIPDHAYTYQLRATRADGAISDSTEIVFNFDTTAMITLPAPPEVALPAAGASIGAGDLLSANGDGVLEHVFEPVSPTAPGIRVLTRNGDTTLPDLSALGLPNGTGPYTWTVRRFSNATFVENIIGADARRYRPNATSAPRAVVLR